MVLIWFIPFGEEECRDVWNCTVYACLKVRMIRHLLLPMSERKDELDEPLLPIRFWPYEVSVQKLCSFKSKNTFKKPNLKRKIYSYLVALGGAAKSVLIVRRDRVLLQRLLASDLVSSISFSLLADSYK